MISVCCEGVVIYFYVRCFGTRRIIIVSKSPCISITLTLRNRNVAQCKVVVRVVGSRRNCRTLRNRLLAPYARPSCLRSGRCECCLVSTDDSAALVTINSDSNGFLQGLVVYGHSSGLGSCSFITTFGVLVRRGHYPFDYIRTLLETCNSSIVRIFRIEFNIFVVALPLASSLVVLVGILSGKFYRTGAYITYCIALNLGLEVIHVELTREGQSTLLIRFCNMVGNSPRYGIFTVKESRSLCVDGVGVGNAILGIIDEPFARYSANTILT